MSLPPVPVRELIVDTDPLKRAFFNGEVMKNGLNPLALALPGGLAGAGVTAALVVNTPNQTTVDTSVPGEIKVGTVQNIDTLAEVIFASICAAIINKSQTVTVVADVAMGTSPTITQPVARMGLPFFQFSFVQGTAPTGTILATSAFSLGLPVGTLSVTGYTIVTVTSTGALIGFGGMSFKDANTINLTSNSSIAALLVPGTTYTVRAEVKACLVA